MKSRNKNRRLRLESLEGRRVLAAHLCNFEMPSDVNGDARVSASDALAVINFLGKSQDAEGESLTTNMFVDVNADGNVTAVDALQVVNEMSASGES